MNTKVCAVNEGTHKKKIGVAHPARIYSCSGAEYACTAYYRAFFACRSRRCQYNVGG